MDFSYYDFRKRMKSQNIDILFPGWEAGKEKVVVFSPHDDDAILGAGYLLQSILVNGGEPFVFIFCNGNAGYSSPEDREVIVEKRKEETKAAYAILGLSDENVIRLDYPDFSVSSYMGWLLPCGGEGTFAQTLRYLRRIEATRLVIPNRYREHIDHEAVGRIGAFDGPQVGDEVLVDWGSPSPIRSFLEYAVWSDFSPEDALISGANPLVRANKAIKAPSAAEDVVIRALNKFITQKRIITRLLEARRAKQFGEGFIELYVDFDPRPTLNYEPYKKLISEIEREH
ncbi:uncharacterized proteins, LmbE homologs [Moorella thermoacetica Y72]|uniref:Uncharacterized proteins, LmbE homologs n=1 Tax=Moorella thermoacetica Y72 TaxID=1325331 RepID=A0A0S6U7Y9_NEOTH|nr:PIG-L family deacetylase [Moorella thermoacetica]GAF25217.1 uncharacterized proteins, LmbE homologs [Moorella thermoacetica Y72]